MSNSRGRARGRGKDLTKDDNNQPRLGAGRGAQQLVAAPPPSTSAWPTAQISDTSASSGSSGSAVVGRRGTARPTSVPERPHAAAQQLAGAQLAPIEQQRGGNGGAAKTADRGAVRGKNVLVDIIRTKPDHLVTKKGFSGDAVPLQTNYFRLIKRPSWELYQYRVDFSPNIELIGLRRRLIREQKPNFKSGILFDGTMLFLTTKLPADPMEYTTKDREENPILITIKFVGTVSMNTYASMQVLNLILRRSEESLKLKLVGRNYFDPIAKIDIPQYELQLWPGYITSIRQHETDILLCAEVTHKVMRTETCYDILQKCISNDRERDWEQQFLNSVLGLTVLTGYNNKTYKITDIDYKKSPKSVFATRDGEISFMQYYERKYQIKIRDPNQPLLMSKASARDIRAGMSEVIALIPELCRVTGLNERMLSNQKLMGSLSIYTRMPPGPRKKKLMDFNRRLQQTEESVNNMTEWNLQLDKNLVEVTGRVLKRETILFHNSRVPTDMQCDWGRSFRNITMFTSVPLKNWVVIVPKRCDREVTDFIGLLLQASQSMNYKFGPPKKILIEDDRGRALTTGLNDACNMDPQLIMCVLQGINAERYSIVKKKCCVDRAVPSQVMVLKTITPKQGKPLSSVLSVATKVVIQINSKLGGAPWMIDMPLTETMVIGFDVCHDTKDKGKSFGALIATMDMRVNQRYFSAVSAHKDGQEMSNEFTMNVMKALTAYKEEHNNKLPQRILIYRDGVGEGQTNYVYEHEITNLRNKLDTVYNGNPYKMVFTIVSKRINTRFFVRDENPVPGTVVDDVVTLPERYDFFLVSQHVRQGTVSPTNYNVIYDSLNLPADKFQMLTYKMTHLYYNWCGTLRVPAVCQYAHKLAFLVGNFIHQSPAKLLEKQLYFL